MSIVVRSAEPDDLGRIEAFLGAAGLPTAGVAEALSGFVVAESTESAVAESAVAKSAESAVADSAVAEPDGTRSGAGLAGVAGLEVHGRDGVLRSVAVVPSSRSRGLGARLTERVLERARESGLRRVYLLTTTAEDYFPRHGFRRIDRRDASPEVRRSVEFREACPASAVAMVLDLE